MFHSFHAIPHPPPRSPLGIKVSQVDAVLLAAVNTGDGASDLSRHEGRPTARTLVVEEDAIGQVHAVRLLARASKGARERGLHIERKLLSRVVEISVMVDLAQLPN